MKRITKGHIFSFILGAIIFSSVTALAVTLVGRNVTYDNTNSGLASTNVQDAVDELTHKVNNISYKPNSVKTWLNSANINKNYTTVSQVLADTTTLQTLINNERSNDYLAISTNWVNEITANETAMTYIGNNDYSADALLAMKPWQNAIVASPYMEKVLNVKVPTMTSNTTPSGEAFTEVPSSSYPAWQAFDNNNSTFNICIADTGSSTVMHYTGYKFASQVKVYAYKLHTPASNTAHTHTLKVQGSNDNNTWNDLYTETTASVNGTVLKPLETTGHYYYYRILYLFLFCF